jgi:hypothetical protein
MQNLLKATVILFSFLIVGCSTRIGDFTLMSTKNVEIGGKYKKLDQRYKGSDSKPIILGFPIGNPDLKQAVDNCIESGKGVLITNAVIDFSFFTIFIYGQRTYTVTGDVWVRADVSDLSNPNIELYELHATADDGLELVSTTEPTRTLKAELLSSR